MRPTELGRQECTTITNWRMEGSLEMWRREDESTEQNNKVHVINPSFPETIHRRI